MTPKNLSLLHPLDCDMYVQGLIGHVCWMRVWDYTVHRPRYMYMYMYIHTCTVAIFLVSPSVFQDEPHLMYLGCQAKPLRLSPQYTVTNSFQVHPLPAVDP
jgi:hypothetical protein